MKIGIISDTHGHEGAWVRACEQFFTGADLILHAGDVAYHGPRNPMRQTIIPMGLIERINASEIPVILAKGNCDSDVDATASKCLFMSPLCLRCMGGAAHHYYAWRCGHDGYGKRQGGKASEGRSFHQRSYSRDRSRKARRHGVPQPRVCGPLEAPRRSQYRRRSRERKSSDF